MKKARIFTGTIIIISSYIALSYFPLKAFQSEAASNEKILLELSTNNSLGVKIYRKTQQKQMYINIYDKKNKSFIANGVLIENVENSMEEGSENYWWEILKVFLPPLANASAFLFVGLVVWINRLRILDFIEKINLKSLSFGDFKIELIESAINKIYSTKKLSISEEERSRIENMLKYSAPFIRNKNILWVDDYPQNNKNERELFSQLKIYIKCCSTSAEAKKELSDLYRKYDLIISDWNRQSKSDNNKPEGRRFVEEIRSLKEKIPVVFYHGTYKNNPEKDRKIEEIENFCKKQEDVSHTAEPDKLIALTVKELVSSSLLPLLKN